MSTTVHKLVSASDEIVSSTEHPGAIASSDHAQENTKFPGFNLYIKNLDDSFTDATLREAFDSFGTITSAKVMCDGTGKSRGFGFVCFTTQEEANAAVAKMNGRIVGTKPLYVAMAQKKEERKQYLNHKYKNFSTSQTPVNPPPVVLQPALHVREPGPAPYLPVNNVVNSSAMQLRNASTHESVNFSSPGVTYVMPTNPTLTYMPMYYQPLFLFPGVNVVPQQPPPPPVPILHQPIFLHSSKTNALIYSTEVQTGPPRMPAPGIQVFTSASSDEDSAGVAVHTVPARDILLKQSENNGDIDRCIDTRLAHDVKNYCEI